jgi:molybdenum cofactor cytidylyltransferase
MDLSDALQLGDRELVAFVGGGGKTTAMYRIARESAEAGTFAVATGTTLFTPPRARSVAPPLIVDAPADHADLDAITHASWEQPWIIVASGHGTKGRYLPIEQEIPSRILALPGVGRVIVEADGSRGRAFKAPAAHEPVIPGHATLVVAVAGMGVIGKPLDERHVHRPEIVALLANADVGEKITAELMANVLAHPNGGRKGVPRECRFAVLLNQVDQASIEVARDVARLLRARAVASVVLGSVREDQPVIEVNR